MICETYTFTSVPGRSFERHCPGIFADLEILGYSGLIGDVGYMHPLVLRKPPEMPLTQTQRDFLAGLEECLGVTDLSKLMWEVNVRGEYEFTGPLEDHELKDIGIKHARPYNHIVYFHKTLQKLLQA